MKKGKTAWWGTVELTKEESVPFKRFLKENAIYYEASACYNLVHFAIAINDDETETKVAEFLQEE